MSDAPTPAAPTPAAPPPSFVEQIPVILEQIRSAADKTPHEKHSALEELLSEVRKRAEELRGPLAVLDGHVVVLANEVRKSLGFLPTLKPQVVVKDGSPAIDADAKAHGQA